MKTAFVLLAVAGLAAFANAECANACSGHGTCETNDNCVCFPNWMANDCSERVCPYGLAFVDSPAGDLNHDGSVSGTTFTQRANTKENELVATPTEASAHFYSECSNKGLCDRETGSCQCFDGYSGSSCQRTTCPNDCSGHGVCRTVQEIAAGGLNYKVTDNVAGRQVWTGVNPADPVTYRLWDADKSQSCTCDEGYSGPDCSRRECPRGDDPLTHRNRDCGGDASCSDELQRIVLTGTEAAAGNGWVYWGYFTFQDWTGETWRTDLIELGTNAESGCIVDDGNYGRIPDSAFNMLAAAKVKAALESIPNYALDTVTVTATRDSDTQLTLTVEFNKNTGDQNELTAVFNAATEATGGAHAYCLPSPGTGAFTTPALVPAAEATFAITSADFATAGILIGETISFRFDTPALDVDGISAAPRTITDDDTDVLTVAFPVTVNVAALAGDVFKQGTTLAASTDGFTSGITTELTKGTAEESTCSNRGLCDYESGLCACFRGYFEDDCSAQNALAGSFTAAV